MLISLLPTEPTKPTFTRALSTPHKLDKLDAVMTIIEEVAAEASEEMSIASSKSPKGRTHK